MKLIIVHMFYFYLKITQQSNTNKPDTPIKPMHNIIIWLHIVFAPNIPSDTENNIKKPNLKEN